jgi:hypothetical protein
MRLSSFVKVTGHDFGSPQCVFALGHLREQLAGLDLGPQAEVDRRSD